jgi:SAM-dependent methyltransferase
MEDIVLEFKKNNFNDIYNQPTPEEYISQLSALDYRRHDFVFEPLLQSVDFFLKKKEKCKVIDLACSYGFNGRIAKHRIPYGNWEHKTVPPPNCSCSIIGIDISDRALAYALREKYIDHLICQNLEKENLTPRNYDLLSGTDLVVASGAFSYVGVKSLEKIYSHPENRADFIGWPTCSFDKAELISFLEEKFTSVKIHPDVFAMRKFASSDEKESYIDNMIRYNPEFIDKAHDALSVFQVKAQGRK